MSASHLDGCQDRREDGPAVPLNNTDHGELSRSHPLGDAVYCRQHLDSDDKDDKRQSSLLRVCVHDGAYPKQPVELPWVSTWIAPDAGSPGPAAAGGLRSPDVPSDMDGKSAFVSASISWYVRIIATFCAGVGSMVACAGPEEATSQG